MMPVILKKYGLKKAIEDHFDKISSNNLTASIEEWQDFSLNDDHELMLFRILQELTNNTIKHSNATIISVSFEKSNTKKIFCYRDNGNGFPDDLLLDSDGMGLLNIMNRAQSIGATAEFSNLETGGAQVNLVIDTSID